jgi:CBS domain containing-hemolysin-like protein
MAWLFLGFLVYFLTLLAELAFIETTPHDLAQLEQKKGISPRFILKLSRTPRVAIASLLVARVFIQVLIGLMGFYFFYHSALYTACAEALSMPPREGAFQLLAVITFALILAFIFWMFHRVRIGRLVLKRASWLLPKLMPLIFLWRSLFGFLYTSKSESEVEHHEKDEIEPETPLAKDEKTRDLELLKSIIKFSDVTVKQVMQQRSKMVALDFRAGFKDVLDTVRESGFSRLPVFDDNLDNITGILYIKDLVEDRNQDDQFEWQALIRTEVLHVPESKHISELLKEFKSNKMHMAIVVDEYGGCSGIVTMEDILEEVTGEIQDEFDEESEITFRKIDDFTYLFEGLTLLNDVCRITGLSPSVFDQIKGNADTLAGLALELQGDIPIAGSVIEWEGYSFTVTRADNRRIHQIRMSLPR